MVLDKTLESPLDFKNIQPVNPKGSQSLIFLGRTDFDTEAPIHRVVYASLVAQSVKNPPAMQETTCNPRDLGSIPGLGRSPEEGNGNPLQYSCLGNPTDRGAWKGTIHRVTGFDMTE